MENENYLSEKQVELIKERIQLELLKRGITASVRRCEEVIRGQRHRIEFLTETFQTVPVVFQKLWVENFNSEINEEIVEGDGEVLKYTRYRVWIKIYYSYEHFSGGTNGCEIFTITCNCYPNRDDIYNVEIR